MVAHHTVTFSIEFVLVSVKMYCESYMSLPSTQRNDPDHVLLSTWLCRLRCLQSQSCDPAPFPSGFFTACVNHFYISPYSLTTPSKLSTTEKSRYCYPFCVRSLSFSNVPSIIYLGFFQLFMVFTLPFVEYLAGPCLWGGGKRSACPWSNSCGR